MTLTFNHNGNPMKKFVSGSLVVLLLLSIQAEASAACGRGVCARQPVRNAVRAVGGWRPGNLWHRMFSR